MRLKMRGTVSTLCASTSGALREHLGEQLGHRVEVGDQQLDARARVDGVDLAHRLGVEPRAAVGQVVARDAGDRRVAQTHRLDALGDPARLVAVERRGLAGVDLAEVAAPGALVAADEERRLAVLPALVDVGAAGFLADGVQALARRPGRWSSVYSGPILARVLIHAGLRSIGVSALRASSRSRRRPSGGAAVTIRAYAGTGMSSRDLATSASGRGEAGDECRQTGASTIGSTSSTVTSRPSSCDSDVTPASVMPHGTMRANQDRSGSQLRAKPCSVTPRATRMPIARDLARRSAVGQPHAAAALDLLGRDAEVGADVDEHAFQAAHVGDDVDRVGQPDDRVADELARSVPGDLAAAVDVDRPACRRRALARLGALARR